MKPTDEDTDNRYPSELTPVYIKVPRVPDLPAQGQPSKPTSPRGPNVVLWTFHGDDHDTGRLKPSDDYDRSVSTDKKNWALFPGELGVDKRLEFVETLILTGCAILDINDYNNGRLNLPVTPTGALAGWPGVDARAFGGEAWDQAMATSSKTDAVILGYNDVAPLMREEAGKARNSMAEIITLYESELRRLSAVPAAERKQWAWMSANVKYADRSAGVGDERWVALHATAIDADYYYYVPQFNTRRAITTGPPNHSFVTFMIDFRTVNKDNPVFRVPRLVPGQPGEWGISAGGPNLGSWWDNRQNFARRVPIPGLTYSKGSSI